MTRVLTGVLLAAAVTAAAGQQPQIQNGKVETRPALSIDGEIATLGAASADPIWIAWRVPMIDGRRDMCSWYSDDSYPTGIRGMVIETDRGESRVPQIAAPTGPVPLEAGTHLMVLARVVDKRVERLRTLGDDCPIDANGRTVYWLDRVTPAESLKVLERLTRPDYATMTRSGADNLVSAAISAIGLHRDPAADALLDRMAASDPEPAVRRQAASSLATARGPHGFETLKRLLDTERRTDARRSLVGALVQTRQPQTVDALLGLARTDPDEQIRADAVYYLPLRGGDRVTSQVRAVIEADKVENVKRRGVSGLARLPNDAGVPTLIDLARTSQDPVIRKQAVSELGRSKDARAMAYLLELIK
jgi:hypothetical protein